MDAAFLHFETPQTLCPATRNCTRCCCTVIALQAAAIAYRIAFGPRAGHKMLTLRG